MTPASGMADLEERLAEARRDYREPPDDYPPNELPPLEAREPVGPASIAAEILTENRLDLDALLDPKRPPREWAIHSLIPAGASVSVVAPAGRGKSLLVLGMVLAMTRGHKSFADLTIPRARRAVYVDTENTEDDLAERLPAFGIVRGDDLAGLVYLHLPTLLPPLDTALGGGVLAAIVDAVGLVPGDLVVLDSWQRVVSGPENDADTMRAFYRHTGAGLKRRRLTVIRLDNTGKDAARGARGTSGKKDDVDLELILERDADDAGRMRIAPGKTRLPDIHALTVQMTTDDEGRVTYSAAGDPRRAQVLDAWRVLDDAGVAPDTGQIRAWDEVKHIPGVPPRWAVREAQRERRACV